MREESVIYSPIETAPKDVWIIVMTPKGEKKVKWGFGCFRDEMGRAVRCTKWRNSLS